MVRNLATDQGRNASVDVNVQGFQVEVNDRVRSGDSSNTRVIAEATGRSLG